MKRYSLFAARRLFTLVSLYLKHDSFSLTEIHVHQVMWVCFQNEIMLTAPNWIKTVSVLQMKTIFTFMVMLKKCVLGKRYPELVTRLTFHIPRLTNWCAMSKHMVVGLFFRKLVNETVTHQLFENVWTFRENMTR